MQESQHSKLGQMRRLSDPEKTLVRRLLEQQSIDNSSLLGRLDSLDVQEMPDGRMGSLYFPWPSKDTRARRFGRRIAELQFADVDGTPVVASLNVDQDGDLYELDIWKVDFKPLISLNR